MNVPIVGQNFDIAGYNSIQCSGNPEADAQNFATANGISVAQAKAILQGQFGAPTTTTTQNTATAGVTNVSDDPEPELASDATLDLDENSTTNTTNKSSTSLTAECQDMLDRLMDAFDYKLNGEYTGDLTTDINNLYDKACYLLDQAQRNDGGTDKEWFAADMVKYATILKEIYVEKESDSVEDVGKNAFESLKGYGDTPKEINETINSAWSAFWNDWSSQEWNLCQLFGVWPGRTESWSEVYHALLGTNIPKGLMNDYYVE